MSDLEGIGIAYAILGLFMAVTYMFWQISEAKKRRPSPNSTILTMRFGDGEMSPWLGGPLLFICVWLLWPFAGFAMLNAILGLEDTDD